MTSQQSVFAWKGFPDPVTDKYGSGSHGGGDNEQPRTCGDVLSYDLPYTDGTYGFHGDISMICAMHCSDYIVRQEHFIEGTPWHNEWAVGFDTAKGCQATIRLGGIVSVRKRMTHRIPVDYLLRQLAETEQWTVDTPNENNRSLLARAWREYKSATGRCRRREERFLRSMLYQTVNGRVGCNSDLSDSDQLRLRVALYAIAARYATEHPTINEPIDGDWLSLASGGRGDWSAWGRAIVAGGGSESIMECNGWARVKP